SLDICQVYGDPEFFRQRLQSLLDVRIRQAFERFGLGGFEARRRVRGGTGKLPVLDLLGAGSLRLTLPFAIGVDERVGQDSEQPGLEVRAVLILMERTVGLREGL